MGRRVRGRATVRNRVCANLQFQCGEHVQRMDGQRQYGDGQRDGSCLAALRARAIVDGFVVLGRGGYISLVCGCEWCSDGLALAECERVGVDGGAALRVACGGWRGVSGRTGGVVLVVHSGLGGELW